MNHKLYILTFIIVLSLLLSACSAVPTAEISYDPATLQFFGERAYEIEEEFVSTYTNRVSGTEQSRLATEWIHEQFESSGWACAFDEWEIINYSHPVPLRNVVCKLQGEYDNEILMVAHHDIAPTTIQGADNDGSGIAVMLHLAEIFAQDGPPKYTLVFVATDAEEFGLIGSRRYIETHANTENVLAGLSLDNLGAYFYTNNELQWVGQGSGFSPIWIVTTTRDVASLAEGVTWPVLIKGPIFQVLDQAVPVALTDQGPMVRAGIPAIAFGGGYPPEDAGLRKEIWHTPEDTMEWQSVESLEQMGLMAEGLIRQLLVMDQHPRSSGPYLYFESSEQVLESLPLYLIFIALVAVFFLGSYLSCRAGFTEKLEQWKGAAPHFLGLWLPLVASILLLYLFVEIGVLMKFDTQPAAYLDPMTLSPDWLAVILFLLGLGIFLFLGRRIVRRTSGDRSQPPFGNVKSLAFLIIGLTAVYVLIANPFSLLFYIPILFWLLIRGRKGIGKVLDVVLFILGGLMLYALIYFFGWIMLGYGVVFLWYFMNIISTQMFSIGAVMAGVAVIASGLSMVVNPPRKAGGPKPAGS